MSAQRGGRDAGGAPPQRAGEPTPQQRAAAIRLLALDVDGVLTDGRLYFGADGEALKAFDVRDGHGVKLLREAGVEVAIVSARRSPIVERRAAELGIAHVVQGAADKGAAFAALARALQVPLRECGYIGDDWPDLPALAQAGLAATVADAAPEVRRAAHWISAAPGGRGAVRELAEFILRAQGRFEALLRRHGGADGAGHA
jgi:3-deoxy-D-manno-octulosonate 8-phosphate phosphatase (KDO 8-P phosphatase)